MRRSADRPARSRGRTVDPDRYQGRRRLPKFPGKRYAGVVATAFAGAALVAAAAGVAMPDRSAVQELAIMDRVNALDQAQRAQNRPGAQAVIDQAGAEVWKLPVDPDACPFSVTSGFAEYRPDYGWHYGGDLACPAGSAWGEEIYAVHSGEVTVAEKLGDGSGYGRYVRIYHGEDADGNRVETLYGHASTVVVNVGQQVKAGDLIAYIGNTGVGSGAHLHLEVNFLNPSNLKWVLSHENPFVYLKARGVDLENFTAAANGGDVLIDVTDGRANPSPSATPHPSGSASSPPTP